MKDLLVHIAAEGCVGVSPLELSKYLHHKHDMIGSLLSNADQLVRQGYLSKTSVMIMGSNEGFLRMASDPPSEEAVSDAEVRCTLSSVRVSVSGITDMRFRNISLRWVFVSLVVARAVKYLTSTARLVNLTMPVRRQ